MKEDVRGEPDIAGSAFSKADVIDRLAEEFTACYRCGQRPSPAAPH
jgi:hypothetical protein